MTAQALPNELRPVLGGIANVLIPAAPGMPSATEAGVHGVLLDKVLAARPDLSAPLAEVLRSIEEIPPGDAVERLKDGTLAGFDTVALVVTGGYLMAPEVGAALGYPGQEAKLVDARDVVRTVHDGLLDPVIERGPIYRPTPLPGDCEKGRE